jgi:hypothetical protein
LLVAPREEGEEASFEVYDNGRDHRAFYGDGAYYATDENREPNYEDAESSYDKNIMYFDSILTRFEELQARLSQIPPPEAINNLDEDHPTDVGPLNTTLVRWWRWKMRTIEPLPTQIACMNKGTVLRLLGLLSGGNVLQRGKKIELGLSRWVWGLLAKLPDRGELNSEEIGVIRELGKKAVLVGLGLKEDTTTKDGIDELGSSLEEDEGDEAAVGVINDAVIDLGDDDLDFDATENEIGGKSGQTPPSGSGQKDLTTEVLPSSNIIPATTAIEPSIVEQMETGEISKLPSPAVLTSIKANDLAATKARILNALNAPESGDRAKQVEAPNMEDPQWNTKATVDMILTVAGEIYGQRDLLDFRGIWDQKL